MLIFTYQPQSLVNDIQEKGFALVDTGKTNLARLVNEGVGDVAFEAYKWMAKKMCQKTGFWMKDIYGPDLPLPKDEEGDYIERNGEKMVLFPFWGWYLTDGKNQKPDPKIYCFDSEIMPEFNWNINQSKTKLLTLDIPEKYVLLSDANAWYCALEGRPCYDYETPNEEARLMKEDANELREFTLMPERTKAQRETKAKAADSIWAKREATWDNILRLEGRRERIVFGVKERRDVQAVFPLIAKQWIISVDDVS